MAYVHLACSVQCHECYAICSHDTCTCGRYDDKWGDYRMVVGDHIGYRFEILSRLGKGSFGQVAFLPPHSLDVHPYAITQAAVSLEELYTQSPT